MPAAGLFNYAYLAYLSKPKADRALYQQIRRLRPQRIVEVGIGSLERAIRLISVAQRYCDEKTVTFTGFDWFEERAAGVPPLPLIHAHRQLQLTGARIRLVPGDPTATLPEVANSLQRTDLMLLSHRIADADFERDWFYLPRMCQTGTVVLREALTDGEARYAPISAEELDRRAAARTIRRAA